MLKDKNFFEKIPRFIITWFLFDVILLTVWLSGSNLNNKVVALSVVTIGFLSFILYRESQLVIRWLANKNRLIFLKFISLGLVGSILVEIIFWFWEKALGSTGVSAHPNILIDLAFTLPIYLIVLLLFWFLQRRKSYTLRQIFILGGFLELMIDGLLNGLINGQIYVSLIHGLIGLPIFMVVYSLLLLPPAIFLQELSSRRFNNS